MSDRSEANWSAIHRFRDAWYEKNLTPGRDLTLDAEVTYNFADEHIVENTRVRILLLGFHQGDVSIDAGTLLTPEAVHLGPQMVFQDYECTNARRPTFIIRGNSEKLKGDYSIFVDPLI